MIDYNDYNYDYDVPDYSLDYDDDDDYRPDWLGGMETKKEFGEHTD